MFNQTLKYIFFNIPHSLIKYCNQTTNYKLYKASGNNTNHFLRLGAEVTDRGQMFAC